MPIKNFLNKSTIIIICLILFSILSSGCIGNDSSSNTDNYISNDSSSYLDNLNNSQNQNTTTNKPAHYEKQGYCDYVVDGDTIDVVGVGRIRFSGVNTPERGQAGYQEAKDFVKSYCLGKTVYLDIDDAKNHDKYGRTLAVVYVDNKNINALLLKKGYAEIMYIPPSEFPRGLNT
ncbi:MAG: thermonuclease family protein [Methanobacteriaceae archaeon]|nr:thermonuclease family protein [Methanobacteriaceae archaeon]MDP2837411.1 thermonuclease family protein [Methanobacteriaceae archaeon]MDP3035268.1 thermonuclease family protein [Methanobacteriaceae archaeon]MDP3486071.1 thermonuclease family protein [Methanobacteriaceae archaeon]MDP3623747.1 thermonuclease family protein [Methanobacteriaceae archaeon]